MIGPKVKAWRSSKYLRYVAGFPCSSCKIEGYSQAAHPNEGKGMSLKTADDWAFPLCSVRIGHPGCHAVFDLAIENETREERRERARLYGWRMREQARLDGWDLPNG